MNNTVQLFCQYNALGFDTLLIQLNDTWSFSWLFVIFFCGIKETGNLYFFFEIYIYLAFQRCIVCRVFLLNGAHTNFFPEDTYEVTLNGRNIITDNYKLEISVALGL